MAAPNRKFTIPGLITLLGNQMDAVYRMADEDLPLSDQLKLLDMLGKTCQRLASLIEQQRKSEGVNLNQLNNSVQQALIEMRNQEFHSK